MNRCDAPNSYLSNVHTADYLRSLRYSKTMLNEEIRCDVSGKDSF